jgi:hypothetical protein
MRSFFVVSAVLVGFAVPGAAEEPAPPAVREGLVALEVRLDRAVDRVSLPHAARLLGRAESARAYRLPGYGVVLVLTPRALPAGEGRVYVLRSGHPRPRRLRVEVQPPNAANPGAVREDPDAGVETFERQVLVFQQETETARREAEEEMERIVQEVRVREAPVAPAAAAPPPAPPEAPLPPEPPAPVAVPALPPPPPWKFWFETGLPAETRAPEAIVADVRTSVIDALVAPDGPPAGLGGDERVTVAVDFIPGGLFVENARPGKTLVVSLRARDIAARAHGAITPEELRRRVEVSEY